MNVTSLAASPAIEAAICALAIERGFIPGTVNLAEADPEIGLNVVPPGGVADRPELVLSAACGFGGVNLALVLAQVS